MRGSNQKIANQFQILQPITMYVIWYICPISDFRKFHSKIYTTSLHKHTSHLEYHNMFYMCILFSANI
jgi:hypothetical protein